MASKARELGHGSEDVVPCSRGGLSRNDWARWVGHGLVWTGRGGGLGGSPSMDMLRRIGREVV